MPKGIGLRGVGSRSGVGRRAIASRYAPTTPAFLGFAVIGGGTVSSFQPGIDGTLHVFALASGAGGATAGLIGGGGGAIGYAGVRINKTTVVSYSVAGGVAAATDGQATTVNVGGRIMTAGGGLAAGLGGSAVNFDINRTGGAAGASPTNGGTGGATVGSNQGGGGSAGFGDLSLPPSITSASFNPFTGVLRGNGGDGNNAGNGVGGGNGAGGGSGSGTGGVGGAGVLYLYITRD